MDAELLAARASRRNARIRILSRKLLAPGAAVSSGILLGVPYNYPDLYLLSWVAFVPLLWATRDASPWRAYRLGLCTGLGMYVTGAFWIVEFIGLYKGVDVVVSRSGALLFWFCCAQLPACLLLLYRWLSLRTRVHELCLFPPLVAIFYSYFPMLFPVQLAGSQSRFLAAIQATEWFGAAGLDFIVALSNVLLWSCARELAGHRRSERRLEPARPLLRWGAAALVAGWLGYGVSAVQRWDAAVADWPQRPVGIVQPDEAPSEPVPPPVPGYSRAYPPEMALSEPLAAAGAELILWPETRFKGYFQYPHVREAFRRQVASLGVPLVFQDIERVPVAGAHAVQYDAQYNTQYNTGVLLGADGELAGRYRKIKRVPLGEYMPLLHYAELLQRWSQARLPELFAQFEPGDGAQLFAAGDLALTPLICYEVMFPEFTASSVAQGQGRLLVALSNNGWFGDSRQPYQHLYASVLRSVENRISLLHVTNNGPSGLVLPSGRLVVETAWHQPLAALLAVPVAPADASTFFNRHPKLFQRMMLLALCVWCLSAAMPVRQRSS